MNNTFRNLLACFIAVLPLVYLAIAWPGIPEKVPMHFDMEGHPDRIGSRNELWLTGSVLALLSLGVFALMVNIRHIDPKRSGKTASSVFNKLGLGIVLFLAIMNFMTMRISQTGIMHLADWLFPLIGLLFVFLGNYLPALKPNYFAGIRLPWTLSDDDNWRRTHLLAGRTWFVGGLLFAVLSVLLEGPAVIAAMVAIILVMVLIPSIYSYRLFREKQKGSV